MASRNPLLPSRADTSGHLETNTIGDRCEGLSLYTCAHGLDSSASGIVEVAKEVVMSSSTGISVILLENTIS